jgi:hypothetical protein
MTGVLAAGASYRVGYAALAVALGAMALAFTATRRGWEDPGQVAPALPDGDAAATGRASAGADVRAALTTLGSAVLPGALGLVAVRGGPGVIPWLLVGSASALLVLHEALLRRTPNR